MNLQYLPPITDCSLLFLHRASTSLQLEESDYGSQLTLTLVLLVESHHTDMPLHLILLCPALYVSVSVCLSKVHPPRFCLCLMLIRCLYSLAFLDLHQETIILYTIYIFFLLHFSRLLLCYLFFLLKGINVSQVRSACWTL